MHDRTCNQDMAEQKIIVGVGSDYRPIPCRCFLQNLYWRTVRTRETVNLSPSTKYVTSNSKAEFFVEKSHSRVVFTFPRASPLDQINSNFSTAHQQQDHIPRSRVAYTSIGVYICASVLLTFLHHIDLTPYYLFRSERVTPYVLAWPFVRLQT